MTDDTANRLLEMVRHLSGQVDAMRTDLRDLTAEVRMNQRSTDGQLGLIRHQMGSFFGFQRLQDEAIQKLRERVERIERRLDLVPSEGDKA